MILFTSPEKIDGETALINRLCDLKLSTLHLRKPNYSLEEMVTFIHSIDPKHWSKIMIHNHFNLIHHFPLKGIHFSEKNKPLFDKYCHSKSCKSWASHQIEEIERVPTGVDYTFLSPVFPSISKVGYQSEWNLEVLSTTLKERKNLSTKVFALGGISLDNAQQCKEMGFDDFAVLGAIWEPFRLNKDIQLTTDIFLKLNSL